MKVLIAIMLIPMFTEADKSYYWETPVQCGYGNRSYSRKECKRMLEFESNKRFKEDPNL